MKSVKILRKVLEFRRDLLLITKSQNFNIQWKITSFWPGVKNSKAVNEEEEEEEEEEEDMTQGQFFLN